jgi:hypothetical protein
MVGRVICCLLTQKIYLSCNRVLGHPTIKAYLILHTSTDGFSVGLSRVECDYQPLKSLGIRSSKVTSNARETANRVVNDGSPCPLSSVQTWLYAISAMSANSRVVKPFASRSLFKFSPKAFKTCSFLLFAINGEVQGN